MSFIRSVATGLLTMTALVVGLTGCGQKGPLTLPGAASAASAAAPSGK